VVRGGRDLAGRSARRRDPAPDVSETDVLRLRADAGAPPEDLARLPARAGRAVAVAHEVGAPVAAALDGALAAEEDARRARRAVAVASAQTRVVAGGLVLAPVLLVPGLGRLVGADLVGFYRSGPGLLVLAVGLALLGAGALTVAALVRRVGRATAAPAGGRGAGLAALAVAVLVWRAGAPALAPVAALVTHQLAGRSRRRRPPAGLDEAADLAATALAGGVSVPEALRVAAGELPDHAPSLHRLAFDLELGAALDGGQGGRTAGPVTAPDPGSLDRDRGPTGAPDPVVRLERVLAAATSLGAPAVPTLRRLASDLRADDLARVLAAAERLPAQLTFPTTLCLLPATVLLVGAPIVHAGLAGAGT
jgi:hypothetical protein